MGISIATLLAAFVVALWLTGPAREP